MIRLAREAMDMTAQDAAEASRARDGKGVSAAYWRDVERGYGGRRGQRVPTRASARALAAMARVTGVLPAQLTGAGREDAARVLEEILRREGPVPLKPAPPPRRDVEFRGTGSAADLEPYVTEVRQEAYEALAGLFGDDAPRPDDPDAEAAMSALPGRAVFPGGSHQAVAEAATWDKAPYSFGERVKIIAIGRQLRARADERENRRTGLSHYPATGAGIALVSVAGRAVRASS